MNKIIFLIVCVCLNLNAAEKFHPETIAILKYGDELPPCIDRGVWIDPWLDVPRGNEKLSKVVFPFLLKPLSQEDLTCLEHTILDYYKDHGRPVVSVVIPPQDLTKGVLKIVIVEPTLSSVCLRGNRWTSDSFIKNGSGLCEGQILNSYDLQQNLAWINRSPFRRTDIVLSAGDQPGTTSAELVTKENFPLRVYAGADNTGTVYLTHTRIYSGFNAGNLWGLDHQASFQWTTAPNPHTLTAFAGQYLAPFPWRHQLMFYGGYSKFKGDIPAQLMSQNGKAWQISGRYQIPFGPIFGNFLHQLSIGYDFKRTNSELLFGGIPFQGGFADINQFYFGYLLDYRTCKTITSLNAEVFGAPFHITHDQNNEAFQTLRPYAKSKYMYGRLRLSHTQILPKEWEVRVVAAGQLTGWNLLASEQFPLGGYETVRGYEERAFNADSGVMASVELGTPKMASRRLGDLEILGFFDYGWGRLHQPFVKQKKKNWLAGVGPGVRYHYLSNVVLRGDVGFPLHKAGTARHGVHWYGGATVSY
ncbi:MAG: BamA/TamA family outer membrane protein [Parachlamydiales bacterium]|nr:BamA/TamA family outer membrane protein [Parachlamydiales bacterium]